MAPPGPGALRWRLLQAAEDGDLQRVKKVASALDGGNGRIREAVEAVRDLLGFGALHIATGHGRMLVCAYLVGELQVDVNAVAGSGDTPLSCAVRHGRVDIVRYLLEHGANPNKPVVFDCTSLHLAVGEALYITGKCEIVELLLSNGADVNLLSHIGTPLHVAAMENQDAAMKILLDHHADCNKGFTIFTPLFTALKARSLNCTKLLLKAGADVMKGIGKATPLIFAAMEGLTDFYECLLEAGADPYVPDECGHLPIEIAAYEGRQKDVEILFPVTSRIPSVRDWSVDGILTHVKSMPTDEDDPVYNMSPAELKLEGSKAYKRKDYSTAVKLYTAATMNGNSVDATLYSNRSLCWIKMGEGEKALFDADMCRCLQPDWPKACYRQGAAHMFLKDYEKACDAFLDGLKLDPANVEIENALSEASNSLKISRATKQ
ncbi:hypothetical protein ACP70R_026984 [Stipagrostis hirtigluma subsp. patula]